MQLELFSKVFHKVKNKFCKRKIVQDLPSNSEDIDLLSKSEAILPHMDLENQVLNTHSTCKNYAASVELSKL